MVAKPIKLSNMAGIKLAQESLLTLQA